MKEEARFQIRGEVTEVTEETYKDSTRASMVVRVKLAQDRTAVFRVSAWGGLLSVVARASKGRQVLIIGRLSGGMSQGGYYNTYLSADAILVEPGAEGAYGAASPAPAPHEQAKANGYQPQPMPLEDDEDIPF